MELGGSDPFLILSDGNIDKAVDVAIASRLRNCGQVCFASKRFLIHESRYDEFKTKLVSRLSQIKVGDPLDETVQMGPLARWDLLQNIDRQVSEGVANGGKLVLGGVRQSKDVY